MDSDTPLASEVSNHEWDGRFPSFKAGDKPPQLYPKAVKPFTWLVVASRNQGKSHLFRYVWETDLSRGKSGQPRWHIIVLMSNTLRTGQYEYLTRSPTCRAYSDFDEDVVDALFDLQDSNIEQSGRYLNILLVLDDVVSKETVKSAALQKVFLMGRHFGISLVWMTQSPQLVRPILRNNVTVLSVLRIKSNGREHICKSFLNDLVEVEGVKADSFSRTLLKEAFRVPYRSLTILFEEESNDMWDAIKVFVAGSIACRRRRADEQSDGRTPSPAQQPEQERLPRPEPQGASCQSQPEQPE